MDGNEHSAKTVEVHINLNGQTFVGTMEQNHNQTSEDNEKKHPQEVEQSVSSNSLNSHIHLHSLPNMQVHILRGSPHGSDTDDIISVGNPDNQSDVCEANDITCTPTMLLSDTISMNSSNLTCIPQAVVLTTPVLSSICQSSDSIEGMNDDHHNGLLIPKSETSELLIVKTEPAQALDDSCIGLAASASGMTNTVPTATTEGIAVTAHQTSMCYLRQIFDHDQVTSQGQMPTLAHGVASHNLPELQQCKWQGCCQHFLSLEDLVRHVNEYHIRTDKHSEFCCYWQGCSRNGKGFNARYKMLIHMRTHTGEKPHKCCHDNCGKSFSRLENLKIHQRSHTGERPYVCPIEGCGKRYSNSSDRFKHTRTHYERKPYHCRIEGCEKCYTDPSSLRKHLKTHHGQDVNIEEQE